MRVLAARLPQGEGRAGANPRGDGGQDAFSADRDGCFRGRRRGSTFWCWRPIISMAATARPISMRRARIGSTTPKRFAALSWIAARIADEGVSNGAARRLAARRAARPRLAGGLRALLPEDARRNGALHLHRPQHRPFTAVAPAGRLGALRLERSHFVQDGGFEFWGRIDALKAGLVWADRITTVSPTYARELTRPEFGAGLDGVIRSRAGDLSGILNGIDTEAWNPARDKALVARYRTPRGKARNRKGAAARVRTAGGAGAALRRCLAPDPAEGARSAARCAAGTSGQGRAAGAAGHRRGGVGARLPRGCAQASRRRRPYRL